MKNCTLLVVAGVLWASAGVFPVTAGVVRDVKAEVRFDANLGDLVRLTATHAHGKDELKPKLRAYRFVVTNSDGRTVERWPDSIGPGVAEVTFDLADFAPGENTAAFVIREAKGTNEFGRATCAFTVPEKPRVVRETLARRQGAKGLPVVERLGTVAVGLVESNPVVYRGKPYLYEFNRWRNGRFRPIEGGLNEVLPPMASNLNMSCAFVDGTHAVVTGTLKAEPGIWDVFLTESDDLRVWTEPRRILSGLRRTAYNTTMCKPDGRFYMLATERTAPPDEKRTHGGYQMTFSRSDDLRTWTVVPDTTFVDNAGSPCLKYHDGWYYFFHLFCSARDGFGQPFYVMRVARSRDLKKWTLGNRPVLEPAHEDRRPYPGRVFTPAERAKMMSAEDRNTSDIDMCDFDGDLLVSYSWGNQGGNEYLALGRVRNCTEKAFCESFFAPPPGNRMTVGDLEVGFEIDLGTFEDNGLERVRESSMKSFSVEWDGARTVGVWRGHPVLGEAFEVRGELKEQADGSLAYSFSYAGGTSAKFIRRVVFPVVSAPHTAKATVLTPYSIGRLTHPDWAKYKPGDEVVCFPQSGAYRAMRFGAICNEDGRSLYVDWRTPGYHSSNIECRYDRAGRATLGVHYDLPMTGATRRASERPFTGMVRTYAGSWWEATQIYRPYAVTRPEYAAMKARRAEAGRLLDVTMWFWNRGEAEHVIAPVERFAKDAGTPVALDWYWWHKIPYDTCYPNFWPPREGEATFRAAIERLKRQNVYAQVYINGVSRGEDDPDWANGGDLEACWDCPAPCPGKSPRRVVYNRYSNVALVETCGEAPVFEKKLREVAHRLVKDGGLESVYIDQIGCTCQKPCYNRKHRHAPGDCDAPVQQYQDRVRKIRAENPGVHFSTEDLGEAYLGLFDSQIVLGTCYERFGSWNFGVETVPAFDAIYHDVTVNFGGYTMMDGIPPYDVNWPPEKKWKKELDWPRLFPDQFAVELARNAVFGLQPCVHNFRLENADDPRLGDDYAFMVRTAQWRHANARFLADALLANPGRMTTAVRSARFCRRGTYNPEGQYKVVTNDTLAAVMHSVWKGKNGSVRAMLVNWTREPQRYRLETPDIVCEGTLPARTWKTCMPGEDVFAGQGGNIAPKTTEFNEHPTPENLAARELFRKRAFGLFIHYGPYSVSGRGEWQKLLEAIPNDRYFAERLPGFKPKATCVDEWVRLAQDAGMTYIVLTTRHHDGHWLGDDFIREFATKVRAAGMGVGLYFSVTDWSDPGYCAGPRKDPEGWKRFVEKAHAKLRHMMADFGKIDYLFYDGCPPPEEWGLLKINAEIRRLQPHLLICRGFLDCDFKSFEQCNGFGCPDLWESCYTFNGSWGYNKADLDFKPLPGLLQNFAAIRQNGGNLLLNVGPMADGTVQPEAVERLRTAGKWVKANRAALFNVIPNAFGYLPREVMVSDASDPRIVYFLPSLNRTYDGRVVACIKTPLKRLTYLDSGEEIAFTEDFSGATPRITIPKLRPLKPGEPPYFLKLEFDVKPEAVVNEHCPKY